MAKTALDYFMGWFEGNMEFYVIHEPPFAVNDSGKCKAQWVGVAQYGTKSFPVIPPGLEKGDSVHVTRDTFEDHIKGTRGLALAPIRTYKEKNNVCRFAVIDIDVCNYTYTWLIVRLYEAGFKFCAFRSKSGGLHLYFFFAETENAGDVITSLSHIIEVFGLAKIFNNKVEIFPKQSVCVQGESQANCIFLPYFNAYNDCPNRMINSNNKLINFEKGLGVIQTMITTLKEIDRILEALPYSDAPYCTQSILLSGKLSEGDYRSNFLMHTAIYLKKKYTDNFYEYLEDANNCLVEPIEEKDVKSIYASCLKHGYDNYWCTKKPCVEFCDKKICKKREYGLKQGQHNNKFTGADCWGELHKIMAKEPYYRWAVQTPGSDEFRMLQVDSVNDLQNQAAVQRSCLRDLNWMPYRVSENDWAVIVNKALEGIHEREVEVTEATDTSDLIAIRNSFLGFLSHKQVHSDLHMCLIGTGRVYHNENGYYFITEGFTQYLDMKQIRYNKLNLRELLLSFGCTESSLTYNNKKGKEKTIRCWNKSDDDELNSMDGYYGDIYDSDKDVLKETPAATDAPATNTQEEEKF